MRPTLTMAAVLAAVLATGCTTLSPSAQPAATEAAPTPSPTEDGASADATPAPDLGAGAADPAVSALLQTAPLASTQHPLTGRGGRLDIELRAERVGELLRVAVTFTPRGIDPGPTALATLLGGGGTHEGISARLIDPVRLLEYTAVQPGARLGTVAPAQVDHPTTLLFYFGAPQDPGGTVDFLLDLDATTPDWPGFLDVPLGAA